MSKLEQFILITLGFLVYLIVFIRIGFILNSPINNFTLIISFISYFISLLILYSVSIFKEKNKLKSLLPLASFGLTIFILSIISLLLNYTYDTSWDGQGYHQTAVIALANNWNPLFNPAIDFKQTLPSQIFAEGYPSSLWEIQASVYSLTGKINTAKVLNIMIALIAFFSVYNLTRHLKFTRTLSVLISFLVIAQPVYLIQLFTFMEDGFGFELLVIAISSLTLLAFSSRSYWSIGIFLMSELLLVTTKYSHLPAALILGLLFLLIVINRFLNREYLFNKLTIAISLVFILIAVIFAAIPYGRNQFYHQALFFPTNIPDLMGSVRYNNVPNNLQDSSKLTLLFYGIFSRAQPKESGDPRNESNTAQLKFPFYFSDQEISDSAQLYNNRVGSGGPLFSGLVLLSICLIFLAYFKAANIQERYAVYASILALALIILLSLIAPTPNLLRYTNQLQLIPFVVIIPVYTAFKKQILRIFCLIILTLSATNFFLFSHAVALKNYAEINKMNEQMNELRNSKKQYTVRAQQFYSSYILLNEQAVNFKISNSLKCSNIKDIYASSTTTQYCTFSD